MNQAFSLLKSLHYINACVASKEKSLKGLDNIAGDGFAAFDTLNHTATYTPKPQEWIKKYAII